MRDAAPQTIYLADYTPYGFIIDDVALHINPWKDGNQDEAATYLAFARHALQPEEAVVGDVQDALARP